MEQYKEVYKRLLPLLPRHEPIYNDSSSISTWKKCMRLYFYKYVLAKAVKQDPVYIYFGSAYHKFREVLSTHWIAHYKNGGTLENFPDTFVLEGLRLANKVYDEGGPEPDPKDTKDRFSFLTKTRLKQSCLHAYEFWVRERKLNQIQILETELPGNFEYANGNRKTFRVDELIKWNGKYWLRDFKCSKVNPTWYSEQLKYKDQPYTYVFGLEKLIGVKIEGILYEQMYNARGTKDIQDGPSIHNHIVTFTPWQLKNWEYEQVIIHEQIKKARELDIYPMEEDEYKCTKCDFKKLCVSNNENQMYSILNANFKTHIWDNSKVIDDE